jgi:ketosteroid isomerase-like protein
MLAPPGHPSRMWDAWRVPWVPELFSAPAQEHLREKRDREELLDVPYFDGLLSGELDALIESFVEEPELHVPLRGRIKGERAFRAFVDEMNAWFGERNISVEDVERVITKECGFEEVVLHLDADTGQVGLPHALVADHASDGRLEELRIYHSRYPLDGRHVNRPPVLQADPELRESDVVAEYQQALAAGDVDAIVAAFEPDGYAREPAGGDYVHRGHDGLRAFYEHLFSNGDGIPLEHCRVVDDGRSCALEYNVVRWGKTELSPQAGVAVYVRGESGKLAAARIYDDADPPLAAPT